MISWDLFEFEAIHQWEHQIRFSNCIVIWKKCIATQLAWPFTTSLNCNITIWWGFFRLLAPTCTSMAACTCTYIPSTFYLNSPKENEKLEIIRKFKTTHFFLLVIWTMIHCGFLYRIKNPPTTANSNSNVSALCIILGSLVFYIAWE